MMSRRAVLGSGAAALVVPVAGPVMGQEMPGLRALAAAKGVLFGSAAATYEFRDADLVATLTREAAILVPEYEMKRNVTEPQPGAYDFSATDRLAAFARANGMAMRGHPLVWYAANPPWLEQAVLTTRNERLLTTYVDTVARRYRGHMHSWDVVNEALAQDGSGWRDTFWLRAFGPAYIDLAFHAAHAADPQALLVYNDYGCEAGTGERLRGQTLKLLDGLLARGVPVQALGLQGHLSAFGPAVDQRKLRIFLAEIEARKLAVLVTELDVDDEGGPSDFAARDAAAAAEAQRFLDVVLDSPAVRTVLTWGLSDRYVDPPQSLRLKLEGWRDRRLPYDTQMRKKPLWGALARAFAGRRTGL